MSAIDAIAPRELAAALGVSTRQLLRYRHQGMPHLLTVGGHARYFRAEVARWLREKGMRIPDALRAAA